MKWHKFASPGVYNILVLVQGDSGAYFFHLELLKNLVRHSAEPTKLTQLAKLRYNDVIIT